MAHNVYVCLPSPCGLPSGRALARTGLDLLVCNTYYFLLVKLIICAHKSIASFFLKAAVLLFE